MPVPKRRTGQTHRNTRRSHHALKAPGWAECRSCGIRIRRHHVCPKCGHYSERLVMNVEE